jgi:hypothetical protein
LRVNYPDGARVRRSGERCFAGGFLAFGGLLTWAGASDGTAPVIIAGVIVCGMGMWVLLAPLIWRRIDPLRVLCAVIAAGAGLACLAAALVRGIQGDPWALWLLPIGALWFLGAMMVVEAHRHVLVFVPPAERDKVLGGTMALLAGCIIVPQAIAAHGREAVWVGLVAGAPFLLAGLILIAWALGWLQRNPRTHRVLAALLVTLMNGVALLYPLGAAILVPFTILAWVHAFRPINRDGQQPGQPARPESPSRSGD